ncbi:hypothetical protein NX801_09280 [Streptomyces sp. LP05-1]|uniref:Uncharacterized protein n=1 Tax=Streptomyces pyxinae TaxID=2970734 RepID=A0ABT2CGW4_9ACTN|nr:hypothetical protein [Streptomyces sp. LP05-1]MCS0635854.1 hypothetical protein [Streptomyces sp. LP05-1]
MTPTPLAMPSRRPAAPTPARERADYTPEESRAENPLVYRAVLPVLGADQEQMFARARTCFTSWLESKSLTAQLCSGIHRLTDTATLTMTDSYDGDGQQAALRLRLREDKEDRQEGTWQTTLTSAVDRAAGEAYAGTERAAGKAYTGTDRAAGEAYIGVDLEHYPSPGRRQTTPFPPGLVRELLEHFTVMDGTTRLSAAPHRIDTGSVGRLHAALTAPERGLPLVVAAEPPHDDPQWERLLTKLIRRLTGISSVYRLDRDAVPLFREATGDRHDVFPGQIRTYLPDVDLASAEDGRRHRLLTHRRLRDPDFRDADVRISRYPRLYAVTTPQPALLDGAAFPGIEEVLEDLRAARTHTSQPRDDGDTDTLRAQLDTANRTIDKALEKLGEVAGARDLAERGRRALDQQLQEAIDRYQDEIADHDTTQAELSRLRQQVAVLQQRLVAAGRAEDAYTPPAEEAAPVSFSGLNDRARGRMPHLVLTYDTSKAEDLDDDIKGSTWASKVWDALLALDSYSALRATEDGFDGTFRDFCAAGPQGRRTYPLTRVAMVESDTVRNDKKYRRQREFAVPPHVDVSEKLFMEAHIKIDNKGRTAPRVHFYDDTAGSTGKVIVGYIGPHLPNTQTN